MLQTPRPHYGHYGGYTCYGLADLWADWHTDGLTCHAITTCTLVPWPGCLSFSQLFQSCTVLLLMFPRLIFNSPLLMLIYHTAWVNLEREAAWCECCVLIHSFPSFFFQHKPTFPTTFCSLHLCCYDTIILGYFSNTHIKVSLQE